MANKSVPQFSEIFDIEDDDLYHVVRGGVDYKIKGSTVKENAKPYKVYKFLVSQTGTSAQSAIVLENTIGTITLSRAASGAYTFTSDAGTFMPEKTLTYPYNATPTKVRNRVDSEDAYIQINVSNDGSSFEILTRDKDYVLQDDVALSGEPISILIEVYP
tara:strand:- start:530 stop:1009 length:480 start_codon:yes stop_codon:yes gene_type:complete